MNFYSPPAAMAPRSAEARVYGRIVYENGTGAAYIEVRLFATDQLIEDHVVTDDQGYFLSSKMFRVGQYISVLVEGVELYRDAVFVPYDVMDKDDFDLGTFVVPWFQSISP
jgi:hypothetical protein